MISLSFEQFNSATCKTHFEERCKILYDQGKVLCWQVDKSFEEPKHCLVCMEEELYSLREVNRSINEKRLFLLRALESTYKVIDALPPSPTTDYRDYLEYKERLENDG